jgi:hypothetical protein
MESSLVEEIATKSSNPLNEKQCERNHDSFRTILNAAMHLNSAAGEEYAA